MKLLLIIHYVINININIDCKVCIKHSLSSSASHVFCSVLFCSNISVSMSIVSVSCGHAHEKYGHKFNVVRRTNAGGHGWAHDFSFKAFENQAPNTIPVNGKTLSNHLMPNCL